MASLIERRKIMMGLLGGVLPSGYTQVEYIETTSAKHDFTPYGAIGQNFGMIVKIQFVEVGAISGTRRCIVEYNSNYGMGYWWAYGGITTIQPAYTGEDATKAYTYNFPIGNNWSLYLGEDLVYTGTGWIGSQALQENQIFSFGARNVFASQNKKQRLYYIEFNHSVGLVGKLIPCYRNVDGHIGMYDVTNHTFEDFGTTTDGWSVPSNN